jgi:putative proteasome-type protease
MNLLVGVGAVAEATDSLRATIDSPYLQIGESKYGRPILDRGVRYEETTLEEAVKYALISIDSTMRSNKAVGPPIDLVVYAKDELRVGRRARMDTNDSHLVTLRCQWEQELRRAVQSLPTLRFNEETDESTLKHTQLPKAL